MMPNLRSVFGYGTLAVIALCLASGAALRLGQGIGVAFALNTSERDTGPSAAPLHCPEPPERLAEALRERDRTVTARETSLNERLAALELAERALSQRLNELAAAEEALAATLAIADGATENDLSRLTAVFEAMKPAEASHLFAAMSPDFAAGFLARLRPDTAAAILAGLPPETAYSISVLVAGRNALAPKD